MFFRNHAGSRRKRRSLSRLLGCVVLAVVIPCSISGCSALSLHKSPPPQEQLPTNPWIKPAKPEPKPNWFASLFLKEKKQPSTPSDWINQKRPE